MSVFREIRRKLACLFFGNTINSLENSLDYASMKNSTIANNISNADTPNYKAKKCEF